MRLRDNSGQRIAVWIAILWFAAAGVPADADAEEPRPQGMFELYQDNRLNGIPNYITEDFLVLSYLMMLERTVEQMEASRLAPAFSRLIERLDDGLEEESENGVRRANQQFLSVISSLLRTEDADEAPEGPVRSEIERVLTAREQATSEILGQPLDYSQFRVRGRYTRKPELRRYFRAARYAGSALFAVMPSQATGIGPEIADRLTAQAVQLSRLITTHDDLLEAWSDLDRQAAWWFGPADDLTLEDLVEVSAGASMEDLPGLRRRLLDHARAHGRQPRILGSAVSVDRLEPSLTAYDVLTGWRLFPQRYSPDGAVLQRLVYDRVGVYLGSARPASLSFAGGQPVKGLPSALELMALLGSRDAGERLDATDERNFEGYQEATEEARALLSEARGLAGEHLELLRFWLANVNVTEPDIRQTNTALAFWTYWRYVGLLYSKPSYSGVSKSFAMPPERTRAWLEPEPELYAMLARGADELAERTDCAPCATYARILERCVRVAVAERAGLELTENDIVFLNDLDHQLFKLIGRRDRPIVVDIHSDAASGRVVQEGLGWPRVVEKDLGQSPRPRGALFRHYELHQPMSERLNDMAWSELLLSGTTPEPYPAEAP